MDFPIGYRERFEQRGEKERRMNERQTLCCSICADLGIELTRARAIYFTLLTNAELREEWERARSWKTNPPALFWKRVRTRNMELRKAVDNPLDS